MVGGAARPPRIHERQDQGAFRPGGRFDFPIKDRSARLYETAQFGIGAECFSYIDQLHDTAQKYCKVLQKFQWGNAYVGSEIILNAVARECC